MEIIDKFLMGIVAGFFVVMIWIVNQVYTEGQEFRETLPYSEGDAVMVSALNERVMVIRLEDCNSRGCIAIVRHRTGVRAHYHTSYLREIS